MKIRFILATAFALAFVGGQRIDAEEKPEGPAPIPAAEAKAAGDGSETPQRTLSSREAADALSEEELRQVIDILRDNYLHPEALSESAIARAGLQGLLDRLGAGARILSPGSTGPSQRPSQFFAENLADDVGYLRLGELSLANLTALDAALDGFAAKPPSAVVLDLRGTGHNMDFELAAECCRRFSQKGRVLFSVRRPKANDEEILTSHDDPKWRGLLVVLVDGETAGSAEVIAAVLRLHLRAYVIGQQTKGEAAQFEELPLPSGKVLRVAVGEVALPDATPVFPGGLTPDLILNIPREKTDEALRLAVEKNSVAPLVNEKARARMNEQALVAGTNPELDEVQEIQKLRAKGETPVALPKDEALQRALDFITTVRIFERGAKGDAKGK